MTDSFSWGTRVSQPAACIWGPATPTHTAWGTRALSSRTREAPSRSPEGSLATIPILTTLRCPVSLFRALPIGEAGLMATIRRIPHQRTMLRVLAATKSTSWLTSFAASPRISVKASSSLRPDM